jgi:hypothetical protein
MELKPKHHLQKVSCKIKGEIVEEGLIYWQKDTNEYFIFQNVKRGSGPKGWLEIEKKYNYKYSWVCQRGNLELYLEHPSVDVTEFKFLNQNKIYELWV